MSAMALQPQRPPKRGIRARLMTTILKVGFLRRFYLRRLLSLLESGGTKKRPLPPQLQELRRAIMRVPERQRYATLETALKQGPQLQQNPPSRALRRAAERQQRRKR
jgi:hypothetical protein